MQNLATQCFVEFMVSFSQVVPMLKMFTRHTTMTLRSALTLKIPNFNNKTRELQKRNVVWLFLKYEFLLLIAAYKLLNTTMTNKQIFNVINLLAELLIIISNILSPLLYKLTAWLLDTLKYNVVMVEKLNHISKHLFMICCCKFLV